MDKSINIKNIIRQILIVLLGMVVVFTTIPFYAFAAEGEDVLQPTISVDNTSGTQGSYVYIYVNGAEMSGIAGMEYTLHYDAEALEVDWCNQGYLVDGSTVDINYSTPGEIKSSFLSLDGLDDTGTLLEVCLFIKNDAEVGTYPITITVGEAYNTSFENVTLKRVSGQLSITESNYSADYVEFYTQCDNSLVEYEDTFTYTLYSWYGESITGGNFEFYYDRDVLEVVDVSLGESLCSETSLSSINKETDGYVKVTFADLNPIAMDYGNDFVNITFKAVENTSKDTEIKFKADSLVNDELNELKSYDVTQQVSIKEVDNEQVDFPDFKLKGDPIASDGTFTIDVVLESGANLAAGDFVINYDVNKVTCQDVKPSTIVTSGGGYLITNPTIDEGEIRFSYVNTKPFEDEAVLATLTFQKIKGYFGTTSFTTSGTGTVDVDWKDTNLDYPTLMYNLPKDKPLITGETAYTKVYGDEPFNLNLTSNNTDDEATITYRSSDEEILKVDANGLVEIVGAGNAVITASMSETANYTGTSLDIAITVAPKSIAGMKAKLEYDTVTYDGTAKTPKVTIEGLSEDDFEVTYSPNINAGTVTVTVTGIGNYKGTITKTFLILLAKFQDVTARDYSGVYDGEAHGITITVPEGATVTYSTTENGEYTSTAPTFTNVGVYAVYYKVTKANYLDLKGYAMVKISKQSIVDMNAMLEYDAIAYDGTAKTPKVTIEGLSEDDFEVTYSNNIKAGTATVTVNGVGNYTGKITKTFTILELDMEAPIVKDYVGFYDGEPHSITMVAPEGATVTYTSMQGASYVSDMPTLTNVGTKTVYYKITKPNYKTITGSATITIKPSSIEDMEASLEYETVVYDGKEKKPKVYIDGLTYSIMHSDFELEYSNNVNVGTATVTITGIDNYEGTIIKTFVITPAKLDVTVKDYKGDYDNFPHTIDMSRPAGSIATYSLSEDGEYTDQKPEFINAGTYTVYYKVEKENYKTVTGSATVTINRKDISQRSASLEYTEIMYEGRPLEPEVKVTLLKEGDFEVEYSNNLNVGTATVVITGVGNYTGTITKTFEITEANLGVSALGEYVVYDGTPYSITVNAPEGSTIMYSTSEEGEYTLEKPYFVDAGSYSVYYKVSKPNYKTVIGFVDVYIQPSVPPSSDLILEYETIEYDGTAKTPQVTVIVAERVLEPSEYELSYIDNVNVGLARAIVTLKGNYTGTLVADYIITEATMEVTANGYSGTYDGTAHCITVNAPEGATVTYAAYKNGSYTNTNLEYTDVGTYTVYYKVTKDNYTTVIGSNTIEITAKSIADMDVKLEYDEVVCDGTAKTPNVTVEGLTNDDFEISYANNTDIGTAQVTITGVGNYTGTITGSFEIVKPKGYTVNGNVTSFLETDSDITVQLLNSDGTVAYSTVVDNYTVVSSSKKEYTSAFSIPEVVDGTYTLVVSKANHVTREYTVTVAGGAITQDVKIHLRGDVTGDGKVNSLDKKKVYNHIKGTKLTGYEFDVANVNSDTRINSLDKKMIYNHIKGTSKLW